VISTAMTLDFCYRTAAPWTFATRAGVISYQAAASFRRKDGESTRRGLAGLVSPGALLAFAADIKRRTVRESFRDRERPNSDSAPCAPRPAVSQQSPCL